MLAWPPAILFDGIYASAMLGQFNFEKPDMMEKWGDMFYDGGPSNAADLDSKCLCAKAKSDKENSHGQKAA